MIRILALAAAVAITMSAPAVAQLVKDGETIADAKLLAAAKAEKTVSLFGVRPSDSIGPMFEAFKKDTGIAIDYVRLPSNKMFERVNAEFAAGKLEADYADLTDLTMLKEWVRRGILAQHKVPWHDRIAAEIKHADGYWYYIARPSMVIGVNTAEVAAADIPKSWADTLLPKWKGRIGMQSIDNGGSAFSLQAFLRISVAPDAWQKIAANEPRLYTSVSTVLTDLVRGRLGVAYLDGGSVVAQIQAGAPLKMVFPSEGLVGFGVFGGVTGKAPHPNAARLWMNYVVSRHGSTIMSTSGAYGTHPDATPPEAAGIKFPPAKSVWTIAPDQWDKVSEPWTEEWKKIVAQKK